MKIKIFALLFVAAAAAYSETDAQPLNDLPNPFRTVRDWGHPPNGVPWAAVTAVEVSPNGDIFVSEGHSGPRNGNDRISKFSKDGKFIKSWGKRGAGNDELNAPHTLALDSQGRLFVGDRNNNRIQIFDQDGRYIDTWR